MSQDNLTLELPGTCHKLVPECKIRIGRFNTITWIVRHGWYSFSGNRPFCGWHLVNQDDPNDVRPLQLPDLADIYLIES